MAQKILTFDEFKKKQREQGEQGAGAATSPAPAAAPAPRDNSVQPVSLEETAGILSGQEPAAPQQPGPTLDQTAGMLAGPGFEWISGAPTDANGNTFTPTLMPTPTEALDRLHEQQAAAAQDQTMAGPFLETLRKGDVLTQEEFEKAQSDYASGKTGGEGTTPTQAPEPGTWAFQLQQAQKDALKNQRDGLQEQYNEMAANIYGAGKKIGVDYTAEDVEKLNAMEEQIRGLDSGCSIILDHHNLDTVQFLLDRIKGQIDAAK